jgi:hypothetical protein
MCELKIKSCKIIIILLIFLLCSSSTGYSQNDKVLKLVENLKSYDFNVKKSAEESLIKVGAPA